MRLDIGAWLRPPAFRYGMACMPLDNGSRRPIMKIAVWIIFSVIALLWTAGTFIAAKLTQWGTVLLSSGNLEPLQSGVAQWPMPEGLPLWLDPAMIGILQQYALLSLEALRDAMPYMSMMMGWLVPLIWAVWGVGLLCLGLLAGGAHWLVAQHAPARS
jgi:hypothetical protein